MSAEQETTENGARSSSQIKGSKSDSSWNWKNRWDG